MYFKSMKWKFNLADTIKYDSFFFYIVRWSFLLIWSINLSMGFEIYPLPPISIAFSASSVNTNVVCITSSLNSYSF
jgi:hypothetical protein